MSEKLYKLLVNSQDVQDVSRLCELLAAAPIGAEYAFFESERHMYYVLPKTAICVVSAAEVIVLTEKMYRWKNAKGELIFTPHQSLPVIMWNGTMQDLIAGIKEKHALVEEKNGLLALIMYAALNKQRIAVADAITGLMIDYHQCPLLLKERLSAPNLYTLHGLWSPDFKKPAENLSYM